VEGRKGMLRGRGFRRLGWDTGEGVGRSMVIWRSSLLLLSLALLDFTFSAWPACFFGCGFFSFRRLLGIGTSGVIGLGPGLVIGPVLCWSGIPTCCLICE
jgi:hypothetical protein